MSNQDSGGGCLLFVIDFIFNIIRRRRRNKYNKQARGVEEYTNISVDILFPSQNYDESVIISGGEMDERLRVCEQLLRNAKDARHPAVILHTANGALENMVARNYFGTVINSRNKVFDAFAELDFNEIYQIVTDSCKKKYDIKPAGRYILQVVHELLINRNGKPSFSGYANCPYFKLHDLIAKRLASGAITQDAAQKLEAFLMTGQTELPKIDALFGDMNSQVEYLSAPNSKTTTVSIMSSIKNRQAVCLDLKSSSNVVLIELIVNSLITAMNRGYSFLLVVDDVPFVNNDLLRNALCQKSNHNSVIMSKDLFALTGGKEDVFSTVIGEAQKTVLFSHSSGMSCEKWAKYIGEYDKIDVSHNYNSGFWQSSRWGFNSTSGETETIKREQKIKPEEINYLSHSEAIVYDHTSNSLVNANIS